MTVEQTTLKNGLRIVSERMDGLQSASLGIWVTAGGRNERLEQNGIAHFLEHMAFKFIFKAIYDAIFDFHRTVLAISDLTVCAVKVHNKTFRAMKLVNPVNSRCRIMLFLCS